MFDRIAGVYDLLNTAMTAGLHHRWRERAADLARVGPGSRVLDVATGTGDLAIELARRVSPGRRGGRQRLRRGDARARARQGRSADGAARAAALRVGATRWSCPTPTTRSTPPRSASARATSPTSRAASRRWRASCAPAGASWCSRSRPPRAPPLSLFYRLWFDRVVPALGRLRAPRRRSRTRRAAGDDRRRLHLPAQLGQALPGARRLAAEMERAGLREIGYVLTAGGIVAIHAGTVARRSGHDEHGGRGQHAVAGSPHGGRGRRSRRSCAAAGESCASGWRAPSITSSA